MRIFYVAIFSTQLSETNSLCAVNSSEICSCGREPFTSRLIAWILSRLVQTGIRQPLVDDSVISVRFLIPAFSQGGKELTWDSCDIFRAFLGTLTGWLRTLSLLQPVPCLFMTTQKTSLLFQVIRVLAFFWGMVPVCTNKVFIHGGTLH